MDYGVARGSRNRAAGAARGYCRAFCCNGLLVLAELLALYAITVVSLTRIVAQLGSQGLG